MLESQQFFIRAGGAGLEVLEAEGGVRVGEARERPAALGWLLPRAWRPRTIEVIEQPEGALVFTMKKRLTGRVVEIVDAEARRVGGVGPGGEVRDNLGKPLADVERAAGEIRFVTSGGEVIASLRLDAECRLSINDELAEQPFAKMLLLAAAIVLKLGKLTC
jgi:hypothetical protein